MSGFLLDTNCISEAVRPKPEPRVLEWLEAADESLLFLSVLTLGEIRKGLALLLRANAGLNLRPGWRSSFGLAFPGGFCRSMPESRIAGDC